MNRNKNHNSNIKQLSAGQMFPYVQTRTADIQYLAILLKRQLYEEGIRY
ncbi:MAG: hypothetical protein ABFD00_02455 [Chloroherpetonaceae bacterium]